MMLEWMIGAVTFTAFAALAAWAAEMLLRATPGQTRWPWVAAVVAAVVWCAAAPFVTQHTGETVATPVIVGTPTVLPVFSVASDGVIAPDAVSWWNAERIVLLAWALASVALFARLAVAAWSIRRLRQRAQRCAVDGVEVLLSETDGPAVVGVHRPEILVPQWVMQFDADLRRAILTHEQQHRAAHDPALLLSVAVVTFLMPWNLPLWFVGQRLRHAVEVDCDRRTLRTTADAGRYAKLLLLLANYRMQLRFTPMMATESTLSRRISAMHTPPLSIRSPRTLAAVVLGAIGIAGACATRLPTNVNSPSPVPAATVVAEASDSVIVDRRAAQADSVRLQRAAVESRAQQSAPYFDFQVDKPALVLPGNPTPVFPDELRASGVEGTVLVQFVVDVNGRAEMTTLKVLRTSDSAFAESVRRVLPRMRFNAAEVRGEKVRQLVQQPFVFSLSGRGTVSVDSARNLTVRDEKGNTLPRVQVVAEPPLQRPATIRDSSGNIIAERGRVGVASDHPYFDFQVDKPALFVRSSAPPMFPPELRSRGIEGQVLAQFVVNEDGRVDMSTFKVLKSTDSLFSDAIRDALPNYTFSAAEVSGRKVKQLVQQPFDFSLNRD